MKTARLLLLLLAAVPAAWGQFQLYLVSGTLEQPVAPVYDLGSVEPGLSASVQFRIRNIGGSNALLDLLSVKGSGFSLTGGPALPATVGPQKSIDFTVIFQSAGIGGYSASLDSVGISVLLTATVPVELTTLLATGTGTQPLGAAPVNFGAVQLGSTATQHVVLTNQANVQLVVPGLVTTGTAFSLSPTPPGATLPTGTLIQPVQSAGFDVQFTPTATGAASGFLLIGNRSYQLTGTGTQPALPTPRLTVSLPQALSAQQGSVTVNLTQAAIGGTGTVSLAFQPSVAGATDSAIAFSSGGQSAPFTFSTGDTQAHFGAQTSLAFQTGSTAGTLTINVQLGTQSDQQSIAIQPAVVAVTTAQASRTTGAIEVDLAGFDNTRSAGAVTFTFFDSNGNPIAPGAITTNNTAAFAAYFQNATAGTFLLKAVFPVTGDATKIAAFQADLTNSAGTTKGVKTTF
jgi:hypothetical protein